MKANEILNKIKNIVGEKVELSEEKIEMAEMTLENGTVLVAESFEAGKSIFIKTDDEQIALPIGEYELGEIEEFDDVHFEKVDYDINISPLKPLIEFLLKNNKI